MKVLITGSEGLVGSALAPLLERQGYEVVRFDIRRDPSEDVRSVEALRKAMQGCTGVVHLAAVSRVIWGEQNPTLCWDTNVRGLNNALACAELAESSPWFVFASSREVYGQPDSLPVTEDAPYRPCNFYGYAKIEGERMVEQARQDGFRACTVRLSNVFGSRHDHADRVVPAFARGAARGEELRIDGADHTFDFTYVYDVADGLARLVKFLSGGGAAPPPIHFVTGEPTTLLQLAELSIELAGSASKIRHAPPRSYDVAHFYGSPARASELLGWRPQTPLRVGLGRLIRDFSS